MDWKEYWKKDVNNYEKVAKFYRRNLFALEGKIYSEKYFKDKGIFVECGSGTSECSIEIQKKQRRGIAIDLRREPLENIDASIIENKVQGTIFKLPFRNDTVDGIWNFGVMEHFKEDDLNLILKEFNRILKNDGIMILFWPWVYSPLTMCLSSRQFIGKTLSRLKCDVKFRTIYPSAFTMFEDKNYIRSILENCGFLKSEFKLSPYGIFTHYVVIASKE